MGEKRLLGEYIQDVLYGFEGPKFSRLKLSYVVQQTLSRRGVDNLYVLKDLLNHAAERLQAAPAYCELTRELGRQLKIAIDGYSGDRKKALLVEFFEDLVPEVVSMHQDTYLLVDPFLPRGSGINVSLGDAWVMLSGPFDTDAKQDVIALNELAHIPVSAFVQRTAPLQKAIQESSCVFKHVRREKSDLYSYDTWPVYFEEILVRAISYKLAACEPFFSLPLENEVFSSVQRFSTENKYLSLLLQKMLQEWKRIYCQ